MLSNRACRHINKSTYAVFGVIGEARILVKCDRLGEEALQRIAVLGLRAEEPSRYDLVKVLVDTVGIGAVGLLSLRVVLCVGTGHAVSSGLWML